MRYLVYIRAWKPEELSDALGEMRRKDPEGTARGRERDLDVLIKKKTQTFIIEAKDKLEAKEKGKLAAIAAGAPPESEWDPKLSVCVVTYAPCLTLRELFACPTVSSEFRLSPDFTFGVDNIDDQILEQDQRVRTDTYADPYIDGHRCWTLSAVFFDNKPVAVFQRAGRDGKDWENWYLVSKETHLQFLNYLHSISTYNEKEELPLDKECVSLTSFYGSSLGEFLERESQKDSSSL